MTQRTSNAPNAPGIASASEYKDACHPEHGLATFTELQLVAKIATHIVHLKHAAGWWLVAALSRPALYLEARTIQRLLAIFRPTSDTRKCEAGCWSVSTR